MIKFFGKHSQSCSYCSAKEETQPYTDTNFWTKSTANEIVWSPTLQETNEPDSYKLNSQKKNACKYLHVE